MIVVWGWVVLIVVWGEMILIIVWGWHGDKVEGEFGLYIIGWLGMELETWLVFVDWKCTRSFVCIESANERGSVLLEYAGERDSKLITKELEMIRRVGKWNIWLWVRE